MVKLLLVILSLIILIFIIISIYCVMVIAGRSDGDNCKTGNNNDVVLKKQICSNCEVGKESYELDTQSNICPYIECLKDGKCQFYTPIEKPSKMGIFNKNK